MPIFQYKARNQHGEIVTGELEASSTSDTASHLLNIGITPVDIHEKLTTQTDLLENLKLIGFNKRELYTKVPFQLLSSMGFWCMITHDIKRCNRCRKKPLESMKEKVSALSN